MDIQDILFTQEKNVCIRTVKMASALQRNGIRVHLAYWGKLPGGFYGGGDEFFTSIHRLCKKCMGKRLIWPQTIMKICEANNVDLIHCHNAPDRLAAYLIRSAVKCPVIYDQHDFVSFKKSLSKRQKGYEQTCNEENDGAIYITKNYRDLVASKYQINPHHLILQNYGSVSLMLPEKAMLPKLSVSNNHFNLVYVGHITQHQNKVRNMIDLFSRLSDRGFKIHVYPTRLKPYPLYKIVPNVVMHKKVPVKTLIREISQYDMGIAFLNHFVNDKQRQNELRFGFWNKMHDYLMAGMPVLTFDFYTDMSEFIKENRLGISVRNIDHLTPEYIKKINLRNISSHILKHREKWTMEKQMGRLIGFYQKSIQLHRS